MKEYSNKHKISNVMNKCQKEAINFKEKVYEQRLLYLNSKEFSENMRFEITLKEEIDERILQESTDITILRYPYFKVLLKNIDGDYYFLTNENRLIVKPLRNKADLGSKENNLYHIAIDYEKKTIGIDFSHFMTDGNGAYNFIRTLLYYYVSKAYVVELSPEGIRLYGDEIPKEEMDSFPENLILPTPKKSNATLALTIDVSSYDPYYLHFEIPESDFILKVREMGATPNVFMCVAAQSMIRKLVEDNGNPIRVVICVNERGALNLEYAHQSLVGGAAIEFNKELELLSFSERCKAIRPMFKELVSKENILLSVASLKELLGTIFIKKTDDERIEFSNMVRNYSNSLISSTISYVGKANFGDAEKYIDDFVTIAAPASALLFQIAAVNEKIYVDLIQKSKDEAYIKEFENILKELNIPFINKGSKRLNVPHVELPWTK